jgi:hypothetical protein
MPLAVLGPRARRLRNTQKLSRADVGIRASATLIIFHNAVTAIFHRYETSFGPISRCMGLVFGDGGMS